MDEQERHVLAELLDATLPRSLPVPQGVQVAARYLLAEDPGAAGGDWFDAVPLPDGRVVVVVGDVAGHGVEASVLMGELRALFDERVREDGDLVAALELLDRRARRIAEARATTLCACLYDPASGALTYCTAGHPPPVVVTAGGQASFLPASGAGPLGAGLPFAVARHWLADGDVVLLYSNGLVGRPGRAPAQCTVELLQVAADAVTAVTHEPLVERVCRRTLELLTGISGYDDDITLLALQVVPVVKPLELRLQAVPDAVRSVRADLDDWLADLRVGALDRTAVLHAVGELVTNVVEHAYRALDVLHPVTVGAWLGPDGVLDLEVADQGHWREPSSDGRGRGLAMASGFLDEFRLEHDDSGTRARGRQYVSSPAPLLRGTASAPPEPRSEALRIIVDHDVVRVSGALELRSADQLRHALARASQGGTRRVTVDLAGVEVLGSSAVQILYAAVAAGPVELVAPMGSPAQHVLDLVRLPYVS